MCLWGIQYPGILFFEAIMNKHAKRHAMGRRGLPGKVGARRSLPLHEMGLIYL